MPEQIWPVNERDLATQRTGREARSRTPSGEIVRPLASLGAGDLPVAGGKGANLGELMRAGFPVPQGFVVTTAAYAQMADRAGLAALVEEALGAGAAGQGSSRAAYYPLRRWAK